MKGNRLWPLGVALLMLVSPMIAFGQVPRADTLSAQAVIFGGAWTNPDSVLVSDDVWATNTTARDSLKVAIVDPGANPWFIDSVLIVVEQYVGDPAAQFVTRPEWGAVLGQIHGPVNGTWPGPPDSSISFDITFDANVPGGSWDWTDVQNTDIRLEAFCPSPQSFYVDWISLVVWYTDLAVDLTSLSAQPGPGCVELFWSTESETDNWMWWVERCRGSFHDWQRIAVLDGEGTSIHPAEYSYTDYEVEAGALYSYRVGAVDLNGHVAWFGPVSAAPSGKGLAIGSIEAIPNPFVGRTEIRYKVTATATPVHATVRVYDLAGRLVTTLLDEPRESGCYSLGWNGKDSSGRAVDRGIYFVRMELGADEHASVEKVLLVR